MYLKFSGHLLDILGEKARGDMRQELGIKLTPMYQFLDGVVPISLAVVVDTVKVQQILGKPGVTVLNTLVEFNAEIDSLCSVVKYTLVNSSALSIDLQLSGNPIIPGYDKTKSMTSQLNLKALYDAGMAGIDKSQKPPYLIA